MTWYNTNFESSDIDERISILDQALKVEKLRPWNNFLLKSASCFHSYFFEEGKPGIVTKEVLQGYINNLEVENKRRESFFSPGGSGPYPVSDLKSLLTSDDHWVDCKFWAQQETLVSYIFEIHYYLLNYHFFKWDKLNSKKADSFWVSLDSITPYTDSLLTVFAMKIDSIKKPFEYPVTVGWDPFHSSLTIRTNIWGPFRSFEEYDKFDLDAILLKLQKLNHISLFKREMLKNKNVLLRAQRDLDKINSKSSISKLSQIVNSDLLKIPDLADSIQLPYISNLAIGYAAVPPVSTNKFISVYFPEYVKVLEEDTLDKMGGVRNLRNVLTSLRGSAKQKIQTLGVEISSRSIFYFLPTVSFCFYMMIVILMWKIYVILRENWHFVESDTALEFKKEIMNVSSFILFTPRWISNVLLLAPGLLTSTILLVQLVIQEKTGLSLNSPYVWIILALQLGVLFSIVILRTKLQQCVGVQT